MSKRTKQLFQEFVVVVVGVFVALAADSWWSDREHRRFEREIRADMLVEFESNVRILNSDIGFNEESRELYAALSGLSDELLFAIPDAVLTRQFGSGILNSAGFDPELGSVQALVESGNIGAVGDRELRLLLSRWEGLLKQCRRKNLQGVGLDKNIMPLIIRAGSDLRWSQVERRELQALLDNALGFFDIRIDCQRELRRVAQDILVFLDESS